MQKRGSIVGGLILIAIGAFFLATQFFPELGSDLNLEQHWPLLVIAAGGLFLLSAFFGNPDLAVPGSFLGGMGLLLYYQNATGDWTSWAYAWALIPGFVGVGAFLQNLLRGEPSRAFREGGRLILISMILFAVFGTLFGGLVNGNVLWPLALIGLGLWLLVRNLFGQKRSGRNLKE